MYQEEYKRWMTADLEDADLMPELAKIEGNDDEIKDLADSFSTMYHEIGEYISKLETALTDEEKIIWERLKHNEYFSKKCLHSEYPITARLEDIWIFGRLDAIVHDGADNAGSKSYWILDYKTGAIPKNPENDFQTMIYLLCADLILPERKSLAFVYIDLKNNENRRK